MKTEVLDMLSGTGTRISQHQHSARLQMQALGMLPDIYTLQEHDPAEFLSGRVQPTPCTDNHTQDTVQP